MNFIDADSEWDDGIERRLAALPVPPLPADLVARCRATVAASSAGSANVVPGRRPRQFVFLGFAALAAAAAAILARQFLTGKEQAAEPRPAAIQGLASSPESVPAAPPNAEQLAAVVPQSTNKTASTAGSPRTFTVRVLPLQNEARSATGRSSIELFHASFLDGLRAIPGLVLIAPESTGVADGTPASFQLEFRGTDTAAPVQWSVRITAKAAFAGPDSRMSEMVVPFIVLGGGGESCTEGGRTDTRRSCGDPASMAAQYLDLLSSVLFPRDPERKRQLQSRLLDRTLDPRQRLRTLADLRLPQLFFPEEGRPGRIQDAPLDDAMIQGVLDLLIAADPSVRASAWIALRGARSPLLVVPLVHAVRQDVSEEVRLLAVAMLAQDFAAEPQARAALQSAASDDSRELVRMIAQKAVAGGTAGNALWRNYVVDTARDSSLTAAQRLEPLSYMSQSGQSLADVLDDEMLESLAPLFPSIWNTNTELENLGRTLIAALQSSGNLLVAQLSIEALGSPVLPMTRSAAVNVLTGKFRNDERARKALETVAADDPDPALRQKAAEALREPVQATRQ